MDRESDPSYLEWVRLKGSSSTATGQDVVELASKLIETLYEQLSEAQALHEASAREFDQKTHVLDQAAASYQQSTQNALFELKQSQSQCQTLQDSLNGCRNQIATLTASKSELEDRLAAAARAQELSEARLRDQLPLQERRATQMASQSEQLRSLKENVQNLTQEKLRLETHVSNLESTSLTTNYELSLLQTECDSLRRQLEQVHADSREKASVWREEKATLTREKNDLERKLVTAGDELSSAQSQSTFATRTLEDRDKLVKKLQAQIDSLQVGQRAFSESSKNSQFAQVAELYKSKFEESDAQYERLKLELQKRVNEAQVKEEQMRKTKENEAKLAQEVKELQIQVANLTEGLPDNLILSKDKLVALIRQLVMEERQKRQLGSTRQNASPGPSTMEVEDISAENSSSGIETSENAGDLELEKLLEVAASSENLHMLIGLQQKYEIATAQLVKQRNENRQLEEYFIRIESEMARTEPLVAETRRKYETTLAELDVVKSHLTESMRTIQQKDTEAMLNQRKITTLQQQVKQTSAQIQAILYQNQSGAGAASNSLADIASLHSRNVDLEIQTRELQATVEALESDKTKHLAEIEILNERYAQMEATISSLEAAISAQEAIHQMSTKKNATKKSTRSENVMDSGELEDMASNSVSLDFGEDDDAEGGGNQEEEEVQTATRADTTSHNAIENSPKYQRALIRIDELQRFTEEIAHERDTWRDSSTRLQTAASLKESELERAQNRIAILQSTHSIHEEQIEDLRAKVQRQSGLVEKYEAEVSELASARSSAVAQANASAQLLDVAKLQVQLLTEQLEQTKLALAQAREQWQVQQAHFRETSSLHTKQEAHWIEIGSQQEARLAQLQLANDELQQDAETKLRALQETLSTLRAEQASALAKVSHLEEIISLKDQSLAQFKDLLEEQKAVMKRRPLQAAPVIEPVAPVVVPEIPEELKNLKRQYEDKCEELKLTNEHLNESKALLNQTEARLNQLQTRYTTLEQETKKTLEDYEEELEAARKTLSEREESDASVRAQLDSLVIAHNELTSEHAKLKIAYSSRDEEMEALKTYNTQMKNDLQAVEETLRSTRSNYQHQVTELGNALSQLDTLQKRVEKTTAERDTLMNKLETTQQAQLSQKNQFEVKEASHASEVTLLQQRIQDGVSNITELTTEISMLKSQVNYWKSLSSGGLVTSSTELDASANINLGMHAETANMEVADNTDNRTLQWVKREYELTLAQLTISKQDVSELRAQREVLQENVEKLTSENRSLREGTTDTGRAESSSASTGNLSVVQYHQAYEKLQAQTEQLNLLRESNVVLRQQRDGAEKEMQDLRVQVRNLEQSRDHLQSLTTRLTHEKNTATDSVHMLTQQNEHWMGRVQELLAKYKDIEAYAAQESKIDELTQQLQRLQEDRDDVQSRLESITAKQQQAYNTSNKAISEKKELELQVNELQEQLQEVSEQLNTVRAELDGANKRIADLVSEGDEYREQLEEYVGETSDLTEQVQKKQGEIDELKKTIVTLKAKPLAPVAPPAASVPTATPKAPSAPLQPETIAKAASAKATTSVPSTPAAPKKAPVPPPAAPKSAVPVPEAPKVATPATTTAAAQIAPAKSTTAAAAKIPPAPPKAPSKIPPPPVAPTVAISSENKMDVTVPAETEKSQPKKSAAAPASPVTQALPPVAPAKQATSTIAAPLKASVPIPAPAAPKTNSSAASTSASTSASTETVSPIVSASAAPIEAAATVTRPPQNALSTLPGMKNHLANLEKRLGQLETTKTAKMNQSGEDAAKAQQEATAKKSTAALTAQVAPPAAAAPKSALPPPPPSRKLPPPPPPSTKGSKRNFSTMSADVPAYVPSTAGTGSSEVSASAPTTPNTAATSLETVDKTSTPPVSAATSTVPTSVASPHKDLHAEAPAAKRPRLSESNETNVTVHEPASSAPIAAEPVFVTQEEPAPPASSPAAEAMAVDEISPDGAQLAPTNVPAPTAMSIDEPQPQTDEAQEQERDTGSEGDQEITSPPAAPESPMDTHEEEETSEHEEGTAEAEVSNHESGAEEGEEASQHAPEDTDQEREHEEDEEEVTAGATAEETQEDDEEHHAAPESAVLADYEDEDLPLPQHQEQEELEEEHQEEEVAAGERDEEAEYAGEGDETAAPEDEGELHETAHEGVEAAQPGASTLEEYFPVHGEEEEGVHEEFESGDFPPESEQEHL